MRVPRGFYSTEQIAHALQMKPKRIQRLIDEEGLPEPVFVGGKKLWIKEQYDAWYRSVIHRSPFEPLSSDGKPLPECLSSLHGVCREHPRDPAPCVYFLLKDGVVIYVGQTTNLGGRLEQHVRGGKIFDRVFYVPVAVESLNPVEAMMICDLEPTINGKDRRLKARQP